MSDRTIGYIVGSISSASINRRLAKALERLAPEGTTLVEIPIKDLPFYSVDHDADYPQVAREFKQAIEDVDGVIIVTPEYSRSIPGVLKNALDWAARPWGQGSFDGKPTAVIGTSGGPIATAAAQQHLKAILSHYNAPTLGQPETFLRFNAEDFVGDQVIGESTRTSLEHFVAATVKHVALHTRESVPA